MKIIWSDDAEHDLEEISEYITIDSPSSALKIARTIRKKVGELAEFTSLGRVGRVAETRELVIAGTPYIAAYTVNQDVVFILAIFHGSQQWPEEF